jgi:hypothetical protein
VPLATLFKIKKIHKSKLPPSAGIKGIDIQTKDLRLIQLGYPRAKKVGPILIKKLIEAIPKSASNVFAFTFHPSFPSNTLNGWSLYDPIADYQRLNLPDEHWRLCTANANYKISSSYPTQVCIIYSL